MEATYAPAEYAELGAASDDLAEVWYSDADPFIVTGSSDAGEKIYWAVDAP